MTPTESEKRVVGIGKPWCCWIDQETKIECLKDAKWNIWSEPCTHEGDTHSCDDHIFHLLGDGKNTVRKIA